MSIELRTEWYSNDPQLARTLKLIASYPEGTAERLELEAALHTWQAQKCHHDIGLLRGLERRDAAASARGSKAAKARVAKRKQQQNEEGS